ncbi:MAG: hypothetical protein LAT57_11120, partial [Balneolales bacterium]|nr:hypothetical protein [Balneolales bacterium]
MRDDEEDYHRIRPLVRDDEEDCHRIRPLVRDDEEDCHRAQPQPVSNNLRQHAPTSASKQQPSTSRFPIIVIAPKLRDRPVPS